MALLRQCLNEVRLRQGDAAIVEPPRPLPVWMAIAVTGAPGERLDGPASPPGFRCQAANEPSAARVT